MRNQQLAALSFPPQEIKTESTLWNTSVAPPLSPEHRARQTGMRQGRRAIGESRVDWFAHFNRAISPALRDYFRLNADKPARELEELLLRLELAERRARSDPCRDEARPAINPSDAPFSSGSRTHPKPWLKPREADGDWLQEFGRRAGPRLREAFGKDLDSTPENIIGRIEQLRIAEQSLLKSKLK